MKTRLKAKRHLKDVKKMRNATKPALVRVGVLSSDSEHPKGTSGQTIAEVAFWNETGTVSIPPRPFLARTMTANNYYKAHLLAILRDYIRGQKTWLAELNVLGLRAANDVKNTITSIMTPPNSERTQRKKANKSHVKESLVNNPLIDSGALRASIAHEVD